MNKDIETYVSSCHKCLSTKKGRNFKPPMTIRDPAPFPFAHICLDTLECSKTKRGNHLIQVVSDYHTRSVICWPTHSNTAETLAHEIFDRVFSKHGAPLILFSDNGSSFTSDLFKNICKIAGIKQKFSSSFRPQTQGIVERANRTILTKLRTLISEKQDDWDLLLPHVEWSINSTPAYSTGHTPFMLLYGYNPPNMYDAKREVPILEKAKSIQSQFAERLALQRQAEQEAYNHLKVVQKDMKRRYDKNARVHTYTQGDIVYLFVPRLLRKDTKMKLTPLYHGPFLIMDFTSPVTATIKRLKDAKIMPKAVHVSRLKKAALRDLTVFQHNYEVDEENLPCTQEEMLLADPLPIPANPPKKVVGSILRKKSLIAHT